MSDASGAVAPAGWYDDGQHPGQERYWDGAQWTEQFRPVAAPVTPDTELVAPDVIAAGEAEAEIANADAPGPAVVDSAAILGGGALPVAAEIPPIEPTATESYAACAPEAQYPADADAGQFPPYVPLPPGAPGGPRKRLATGALVGFIVAAVVGVAANGGGISTATSTVTVIGTAGVGPFAVTAPNMAISVAGSSPLNVTCLPPDLLRVYPERGVGQDRMGDVFRPKRGVPAITGRSRYCGEAFARGCSSMAELQLPKLVARVRFPSSPPRSARRQPSLSPKAESFAATCGQRSARA